MHTELALSKETGSIGIMHLKRYWHKAMAKKEGRLSQSAYEDEWNLDVTLLSALGLGREQTVKYLFLENPGFHEFEQWIIGLNGGALPADKISHFNHLVTNRQQAKEFPLHHVLDQQDLQCWNENGYVIVREAVSKKIVRIPSG